MLVFIEGSSVSNDGEPRKTTKEERQRLDKVASSACIPVTALATIATTLFGRQIHSVYSLGPTDNRKLREYIKRNRTSLFEQYHRKEW